MFANRTSGQPGNACSFCFFMEKGVFLGHFMNVMFMNSLKQEYIFLKTSAKSANI